MARRGEARSPYNKYNKKPHRYSQLYQDWKAAKSEGSDTLLTKELAARHTLHHLNIKLLP